MIRVIYQRNAPSGRRYFTEYRDSRRSWTRSKPGYRTRWVARLDVLVWNSIGYDARVIDTRPRGSQDAVKALGLEASDCRGNEGNQR